MIVTKPAMADSDRTAIVRDVAERLASALGNGAKTEAAYNGRAFRITSTSKLIHEYPVDVSLSTERYRGPAFNIHYHEPAVRGVTISLKAENYRTLWTRTRKVWTDSQIAEAAELVRVEYTRRFNATHGLKVYKALAEKCGRLPGLHLEPRTAGVEITLTATSVEQIRAIAAAFVATGGQDVNATPAEE